MKNKLMKPFNILCLTLMIVFFGCKQAKDTTEQVIENVVEEVIENVVDTLLTPVEEILDDSNDLAPSKENK